MATKNKMTGVRLTDELNYKIRYIAEANHRKLNDELRLMIDNHIKAYEAEHGEIRTDVLSGGGVIDYMGKCLIA